MVGCQTCKYQRDTHSAILGHTSTHLTTCGHDQGAAAYPQQVANKARQKERLAEDALGGVARLLVGEADLERRGLLRGLRAELVLRDSQPNMLVTVT